MRKEFDKNTGKMQNSSIILEEDFVCLEVFKIDDRNTVTIKRGANHSKESCKTLKKVTKKSKSCVQKELK